MTTAASVATRAEGEAAGHLVTLVSEDIWGLWRPLNPQERAQAQQRAELSQQLTAEEQPNLLHLSYCSNYPGSLPPLCYMCQINRSLDELIQLMKTKEAFFLH